MKCRLIFGSSASFSTSLTCCQRSCHWTNRPTLLGRCSFFFLVDFILGVVQFYDIAQTNMCWQFPMVIFLILCISLSLSCPSTQKVVKFTGEKKVSKKSYRKWAVSISFSLWLPKETPENHKLSFFSWQPTDGKRRLDNGRNQSLCTTFIKAKRRESRGSTQLFLSSRKWHQPSPVATVHG